MDFDKNKTFDGGCEISSLEYQSPITDEKGKKYFNKLNILIVCRLH